MNDPSESRLPQPLTDKLTDFRRRVRITKFVEGILAAAFGLALSWTLVFILDRFGETPAWLRTTLLIAGTAIPGIGLPLIWHRWVWRQRRLEDVARLIRRRFPRLGDQLLGIVELAHDEENPEHPARSQRLVDAAIAQAAEAVTGKNLEEAVPTPGKKRRWAVAAVAILALVIAAGFAVPEAAKNAAARWLMPWKETDRYTFAQVDALPETLVVPFAEPFEMPASLKDETRWTPERASARISGQPKVRVAGEEGNYPFAFPPQKGDTEIALSVGDDRERVTLQPRDRPELTSLIARVRLPDYLQYGQDQEIEVRGANVRLLGGASVSWTAEASRELKSGSIDDSPAVVAEGKLVTDYHPVTESAEHTIAWKDVLGLTPREPLMLKVQAVEDESPTLTARRENQEQVVLDTEVVTFDLAVRDDFGIRQVGLEWNPIDTTGGRAREATLDGKITAAGEPEMRRLDTRATFSAAREGLEPQSIEIRAWAEDYLPGRERSYSPTFVLHILDATDHALWLTAQFGKWLEAARESYEREQQLHETNKELRSLTATELDRPENRRRVSRQAADEQANAARLDSLNDAGRRLVEHGVKNSEFDAERLESWATMLQNLDEIAEKRMPSVADLLKESSGAAGAKPGQTPPPSESPAGQPKEMASSSPSGDPTKSDKPAEEQGTAKPGAPIVKNGELPALPGPPKPQDPDAETPEAVPGIVDNEAGFNKPPEPQSQEAGAPSKPSKGALGLPSTTLGALPGDGEQQPPPPAQSPAQQKLDDAIEEQRDLLAEFAKVADDLSELLASLEASTFVKRLKAASRAQMEIASTMTTDSLSAFGIEKTQVSGQPAVTAEAIADRTVEESETVYTIQTDLAAFVNRKPDMRFTSLLDAMKKTQIVREIESVGVGASKNFSGQSIAAAEYWADTLDRWAEDLVAAAQCSSCSSCDKESLPPEIVLKVMQALNDEMDLRDETRELEKARSAMKKTDFDNKAFSLAETQRQISDNVHDAVTDIHALPNGAQQFGKEIQLLSAVREVMRDARDILASPNTGEEAIAAETLAIELLLQAKRQKPGGGGGGGANPGGGGGAAFASTAAIGQLGDGSDSEADIGERSVGQSTGRAGREFPEEFKSGLDAYFNTLEKEGGATP